MFLFSVDKRADLEQRVSVTMDLYFDCRANLDSYQLITAGSNATQSLRLVTINVLHSRPEYCAHHTLAIFFCFLRVTTISLFLNYHAYNMCLHWPRASHRQPRCCYPQMKVPFFLNQNQSNQVFLTTSLSVRFFFFSAVFLPLPSPSHPIPAVKPHWNQLAVWRAKPIWHRIRCIPRTKVHIQC